VPKRVLIDGRLLGYRHGGIATYARQLALHTPPFSRGMEIRLATRREIPELSDRTVRSCTPPHHRLERIAFGLEVDLRKPDLLHSVDYVQPRTFRRVKTVVTVHDLAFLNNPDLVTPDSWRYYSQALEALPAADRVITVSRWTRQQLLEHVELRPEQVVVVPNGYDDAVFTADANLEQDRCTLSRFDPALSRAVTEERPVVLAVGTIEPRKRLDILIDAFERHQGMIANLAGASPILVIAGQVGWLAHETIARLRLLMNRGDAVWARDMRDEELAALYRSATLLAMPSVDEGFGLPVLEAMASGTPSLTSDLHAVKEIIQDNGFLEESSDSARWAEKIGRIIADREIRERRGRRGIERAAEFTWRESARRTVDVYRGVLNER
jgi:glycosyltransferase involved in cell wall biosynthesis